MKQIVTLFILLLLFGCGSPTNPPAATLPPAQPSITGLDIITFEARPVQVNVVVRGVSYAEWCAAYRQVEQARQGQQFILGLRVSPRNPNESCPLTPFEQVVPLEVDDLTAGTYQVIGNSISATFTLTVDNRPETATTPPAEAETVEIFPAPVETVTLEILEGMPPQVSAVVRGTFPTDCYEVGDISQTFEAASRQFNLRVQARHYPQRACPPQATPFGAVIPLEVTEQRAGDYRVRVNGVTAGFTLLVNQTATVDETWQRVDFPAGGIAITVPPAWTQQGQTWLAPPELGQSRSSLELELRWMTTTPDWQPTDLLPPQRQITGRTTVDLSWGAGLLYQTETLTAPTQFEQHLIAPLDGLWAYDFTLRSDDQAMLAQFESLLNQIAASAELGEPQPQIAVNEFVSQTKGYRFDYPTNYTVNEPSAGMTVVVDERQGRVDGAAATVQIIRRPWSGLDYEAVLQEQLRGLPPTYAVKRADFTVDGVAAVGVEGLPGPLETRQVFIINEGQLLVLIFAPLNEPDASSAVESLWRTVMGSFRFIDG